jgi:hypothetical protein
MKIGRDAHWTKVQWQAGKIIARFAAKLAVMEIL